MRSQNFQDMLPFRAGKSKELSRAPKDHQAMNSGLAEKGDVAGDGLGVERTVCAGRSPDRRKDSLEKVCHSLMGGGVEESGGVLGGAEVGFAGAVGIRSFSLSKARRAAWLSASFLFLPRPRPISTPRWWTVHSKT